MSAETLIHDLFIREGDFVNNPGDRGGPTKYGITMGRLSEHRGHTCTTQDVFDLTPEEAHDIYLQEYIISPGFDNITDDFLKECVVDAGVLHGTGTAVRWLQQIVSTRVDGVFGKQTLTAINAMPPKHVVACLIAARGRLMGHLIANDPTIKAILKTTQAQFAEGWANRLGDFIERLGN